MLVNKWSGWSPSVAIRNAYSTNRVFDTFKFFDSTSNRSAVSFDTPTLLDILRPLKLLLHELGSKHNVF